VNRSFGGQGRDIDGELLSGRQLLPVHTNELLDMNRHRTRGIEGDLYEQFEVPNVFDLAKCACWGLLEWSLLFTQPFRNERGKVDFKTLDNQGT
jgi:hypothetical protein